jgi:hypothetical protein
MTRNQILFVEGVIVLFGILLLFLVAGNPFGGGGDDDDASADGDGPVAHETDAPGEDGDDDGGDDDGGPTVAPSECTVQTDRDFFASNEIVTFYGNPYAEALGILGQLPIEDLAPRLHEQAAKIDDTNSFRGVQPGLHIVSSTAQTQPGNEGEYVLHVDDQTLREYVDYACREHLLVFLDLQIGRADLMAEIERIRPFLEQPHVHLALDPEFAMDEGEVPGEVIGSYSAEEINQAQEVLEEIAQSAGVPDKILIVHQFQESMIERPEDIAELPHVRVVVTMDGFGEPAAKAAKFRTFAQPAEYSGIKIFYQQDNPVMTEQEIAALYPDLVIFQ